MPDKFPSISAVFLDRDGVINRDSTDYIRTSDLFEFIPGSLQALVCLNQAGCRLIVVTNQSGVGRGIIRPEELEAIHEKMEREVRNAGGRFLDILACPHGPDENCACRKPRPGMILTTARRHGVDLSRSVMIGDSARDIECGQRAGCAATILVRTGNGLKTEALLRDSPTAPTQVADDLRKAVAWLKDSGAIFTTRQRN
jgi:histidinol-phosphate phosphatase family protein